MMINSRLRRAKKSKSVIRKSQLADVNVLRLCIHRSNRNFNVQAIDISGKVVCCASTLEENFIKEFGKSNGNNSFSAGLGGYFSNKMKMLPEFSKYRIIFDRTGYVYHGWVMALSDSIDSTSSSYTS